MNIIRTAAAELSAVPAIAYKQKLKAGGAGIKIMRLDQDASAVFTLDKRTGAPIPYGPADEGLFPEEAVIEAAELTEGLPYSSRGKIKIAAFSSQDDDDNDEAEAAGCSIVESDEYASIIERYSDENGKINYRLLNKDFIQFVSKSKTAADLAAKMALEEEILIFVIKNRTAFYADKKENISDDDAKALIAALDEINARGAFSELKSHIRRMLAKAKKF